MNGVEMVKLYLLDKHLILSLQKELLVFFFKEENSSWEFKQNVKCCSQFHKTCTGVIETCSFSPCGKYFAVYFDKNIMLYKTSDWRCTHLLPGERKASSLKFFPKLNLLLLCDRSGNVSFYSFDEIQLSKTQLRFGHNSMLTSAVITNDEKYIITSDRDEKIRVTNFPNVYNVERYCLGHTQFVSHLEFLPTDKSILVSCSGDGTLIFWDFLYGKKIAEFDCRNENEDVNNNTVVKFVTCEVKSTSILAVMKYKSSEIKIISATRHINKTLALTLISTLQLPEAPWDISVCDKNLLCLLPDKENPLVVWSMVENKMCETKNFENVTFHLKQNFDDILNTSQIIFDDILVLFKREIDNIQEYEQRKKARLLKSGRTS